jgi:hypothetical protein
MWKESFLLHPTPFLITSDHSTATPHDTRPHRRVPFNTLPSYATPLPRTTHQSPRTTSPPSALYHPGHRYQWPNVTYFDSMDEVFTPHSTPTSHCSLLLPHTPLYSYLTAPITTTPLSTAPHPATHSFSLLSPHSLFLTPQFAFVTPYFLLHTPYFSLLAPWSSLLSPHSALLTPNSSLRTPHSARLTLHSSLLTPYYFLLAP